MNTTIVDLTGCHILLVEDDLINQRYVETLLNSFGAHCTVAENGQVAIHFLQDTLFDAILMDVEMPVMNGIDATKHIRDVLHFHDLPIIGLTASVYGRRPHTLIEIGMNEVVTKPFEATHLKKVLVDLIGKQGEVSTFEREIRDELHLGWMTEQAGGDAAFSKQLLEIFVAQFPDEMIRLEHAWQKQDWKMVQFVAHKLKSSLRLFGLEQTAWILDKLEQEIIAKQTIRHAEKRFVEIQSALQSALNLMERDLQML